MKNVGLNNPVEEGPTNETKFPIDGCRSTTSVSPSRWGVMREGRVGVLEERYGN